MAVKLGGPYKKPTPPPKGLPKRTGLYIGNEPGPRKTVRRKGPVSRAAKR